MAFKINTGQLNSGTFKIPGAPGGAPYIPPTEEDLKRQEGISGAYAMQDYYKTKMPEYEAGLFGIAERQARSGLADETKTIRNNYNRRGLLGSGMQMGSQGRVESMADISLAAQKGSIREKLSNNLAELQRRTAAAELGQPVLEGMGSMAIDTMSANLKNEIAQSQAQQKLYSSLGSALGKIGGKATGYDFNK